MKLVAGTARPDRVNKREPQPRRQRPPMPPDLSAAAKLEWRRYAALLDGLGVLTEADGPALAGLCETSAELRAARAALASRGSLTYQTMTATGSVSYRPFPEIAIVADLDRRARAWLAVFGLTPADRSRVSIQRKASDDQLERLFT